MKHSRIYSCPFFLVSLLLVAQFWLCLAPAAYATDMLTTGSGSYDISKATISPIPDCDFNGNAQEPSFTVTPNGVTLQPESEYNYETGEYIEGDYYAYYENNVRPGKASITVTGTNEYSGSKTVYFNIIGEFKDSSIECYTDKEFVYYNTYSDDEDYDSNIDYEDGYYKYSISKQTYTGKPLPLALQSNILAQMKRSRIPTMMNLWASGATNGE